MEDMHTNVYMQMCIVHFLFSIQCMCKQSCHEFELMRYFMQGLTGQKATEIAAGATADARSPVQTARCDDFNGERPASPPTAEMIDVGF